MNRKRELLLIIGIILFIAAVNLVSGDLLNGAVSNTYLAVALNKLILVILAVLASILLKKTWIYRPDPALLKKNWTAAIPEMAVILFLVGAMLVHKVQVNCGKKTILFFALAMLLVGLNEEIQFRGLLQNGFHRLFGEDSVKHVVLAVFCSSLLFGSIHLLNALKPGIRLASAAMQALGAAGGGLLFGAIYFRTGKNLWFAAILHAAHDAVIFMNAGGLDVHGQSINQTIDAGGQSNPLSAIALPVIYALIALFLLRKKKVEPLLKKEEAAAE